jgi:hypothetical protein
LRRGDSKPHAAWPSIRARWRRALLLNIIMYNDRVSKTIQIFPNRAKPAQAAAKFFPRKALGFPSVSIFFPE